MIHRYNLLKKDNNIDVYQIFDDTAYTLSPPLSILYVFDKYRCIPMDASDDLFGTTLIASANTLEELKSIVPFLFL